MLCGCGPSLKLWIMVLTILLLLLQSLKTIDIESQRAEEGTAQWKDHFLCLPPGKQALVFQVTLGEYTYVTFTGR